MRTNTNTRLMHVSGSVAGRLAEAAFVAGLAAATCLPGNGFAQRATTSGADTAITHVNHGPQADPNMPYPQNAPGLDLQWSYIDDRTVPRSLDFRGQHATQNQSPIYLGWTPEEGSWLANPDEKGRIYTWKNNALTQTSYKNMEEIPEATVRNFRNLKQPYLLARFEKPSATGADTGIVVNHGPQADPNMPGPAAVFGIDVQWSYSPADPTTPGNLMFRGKHATQGVAPIYLGWTPEEGSYFSNADEKGRIYTWKNNSLTQTEYKNMDALPDAIVLRLRNVKQRYLLARFEKSAPPPPAKPAGPTQAELAAAEKNKAAQAFFGDPAKALPAAMAQAGATVPAAQVPGEIAGTGATIRAGVLTFTRSDSSSATYKVVRPKVMQGHSQAAAADSTGAWVTMEEGGNGVLFDVRNDSSVTGREMPAAVIQMLMQNSAAH